ncbi:rhodanese-like domain-containing protein [Vibrio maerlii]|uniref:rhodanese-like domain-containing protein n=1 Tax=Vibrio maerlii TaxID=2231648 RepID=UPI000E3E96D1|nr:rhodanese-like domain-containing protein [Vibrio maerlii]
MNRLIKVFGCVLPILISLSSYASERAELGWQLIDDGAMVVDVRTPQEFSQGHLNEAINIPLSEIEQGFESIDKSAPIVLYCRSGARSGRAHYYLESIGFTNIHNAGGLEELKQIKPAK